MDPTELLSSVRRIQIRTAHRVSEMLASEYHSVFRGQGIEFEEVRPYTPGDDVRQIDWNVSARMGEPFIKLFREERELSVLVAVDLSASQDFGTHTRRKRDQIAELVATVGISAITNGDRAGVTILTEGIEKHLPPRRGPRQALRMIREVLAFEPQRRGTDLSAGLEQLRRMLRKKSVVFLVSDFLDPRLLEELDASIETDSADSGEAAPGSRPEARIGTRAGRTSAAGRVSLSDIPSLRALRLLRQRHDVVPVIVADRREREIPPLGLIEFRDRESGAVSLVDATPRRVRHFAELATRRREALVVLLRRLGIEPIVLLAEDDVAEALTRYFLRRERNR